MTSERQNAVAGQWPFDPWRPFGQVRLLALVFGEEARELARDPPLHVGAPAVTVQLNDLAERKGRGGQPGQ